MNSLGRRDFLKSMSFLGVAAGFKMTTLYDPGVHLPLIIRAPGLPAGQRIEGFSEAIDIVPTLLALAGLADPGHLDGISLLPWLADAGEQDLPRIFLA